jgi:hypothetical protein
VNARQISMHKAIVYVHNLLHRKSLGERIEGETITISRRAFTAHLAAMYEQGAEEQRTSNS